MVTDFRGLGPTKAPRCGAEARDRVDEAVEAHAHPGALTLEAHPGARRGPGKDGELEERPARHRLCDASMERAGVPPYTPRAMATVAAAPAAKTEKSSDVTHDVNAAGTHPRGILRWGYFIILNAISAVVAVALFVGVFYADGLDKYMRGTYDWLLAHPGVTSFMAFSPLAASLLVGWGYSQRARKRKAAAA